MTDKLKPGYHYAIVNDCEAIFEKYKDLKYPYCHGKCCTEYKYLAPVPSYEEWQALNGNMDSVMQTNQALCKKLAELKELLKECREVIKNVDTYYGNYDSAKGYLVINKIDEVLK